MISKESIFRDIIFYWDSNNKIDQINNRVIVNKNHFNIGVADAYAILTEWEDFRSLDLDPKKIFDGRKILNQALYSVGKG